MKTPFFIRLPGLGKAIDTMITIPPDIDFFSLKLVKLSSGEVTGETTILDAIGKANKLDIGEMGQAEFIAHWYRSHIQSGGQPIPNQQELQSFLDKGLGYLIYPEGRNYHSLNIRIEVEDNYCDINYNLELVNLIRELNEISVDEGNNEILHRLYLEEIKKGGIVDKSLERQLEMNGLVDYWCRTEN